MMYIGSDSTTSLWKARLYGLVALHRRIRIGGAMNLLTACRKIVCDWGGGICGILSAANYTIIFAN